MIGATDLDLHEKKKLLLFYDERIMAHFSSAYVVIALIYTGIVFWYFCGAIVRHIMSPGPDLQHFIRDWYIAILLVPVIAILTALVLLIRRSEHQVKRTASLQIRFAGIGLGFAVGAWAYSMFEPELWYRLGQFFWYLYQHYSSHWAGWAELALLLMPVAIANWGHNIIRRPLGVRITDDDLHVLREDSEDHIFNRRLLRSTFGVPRVVDLIQPRARAIATPLFILSNACHALAAFYFIFYIVIALLHLPDVLVCQARQVPVCIPTEPMATLLYTLALVVVGVIVMPLAGAALAALARKQVRLSASELLQVDPRKPILFLRPFRDDQVALRPPAGLPFLARIGGWLASVSTLDQVLLEEATPYGPVIAIGNPSDKLPPYGAARGYFDDKSWQDAVQELAYQALAIIICVDDSEGVWWEVENLGLRYFDKTIFLVHPRHRTQEENGRLVQRLLGILQKGAPAVADVLGGIDVAKPVLGIHRNERAAVHLVNSSTFSGLAFLLNLRHFLRVNFGYPK